MFQGFNADTTAYFKKLREENSKEVYHENEGLYRNGISLPLEELYFELYRYLGNVDRKLLRPKRQCVSSAYHDMRFCKKNPMREYCYLRFLPDTADGKNSPGFFFRRFAFRIPIRSAALSCGRTGYESDPEFIVGKFHFFRRNDFAL